MIALLPEWIAYLLWTLGVVAGLLAVVFFVAAAVLIVMIKRDYPGDE